MRRKTTTGFLFLLLMASLATAPRGSAGESPTRVQMLQIFGAIQELLPVSLSERRFRAEENRDRILGSLTSIAGVADELGSHGIANDPGYGSIGTFFASDARRAVAHYREGNHERSRFLSKKLTEYCFACHSRVPAGRSFPSGDELLRAAGADDLALDEQMTLAVATRQFDRALAAGERIFTSPAISPTRIDRMGLIEDYLKIIIRVERDMDRARGTMRQLRARAGVPAYLVAYLDRWMEGLTEVEAHLDTRDRLAVGRGLVRRGRLLNEYPADRSGLVQFLAASSLIHQYVDSNPGDRKSLAEAYYLLGITEDHVSRTSWLPETEIYLESAIRTGPGTDVARSAYRYLEEYLIEGYTGSAGTILPPDVELHLRELYQLLNLPD